MKSITKTIKEMKKKNKKRFQPEPEPVAHYRVEGSNNHKRNVTKLTRVLKRNGLYEEGMLVTVNGKRETL